MVVGNSGSFRAAAWAARRAAYALARRDMAGVRAARRSWTRGEWIRGEVRAGLAQRACSPPAPRSTRPCPRSARGRRSPARPASGAKTRASPGAPGRGTFRRRGPPGSAAASRTGPRSPGRRPKASTNGRAVVTMAASRSDRQMLRPSTRPSESTSLAWFSASGSPPPARGPRTRSRWSPATGSFSARSRFSLSSPKYVVSMIFAPRPGQPARRPRCNALRASSARSVTSSGSSICTQSAPRAGKPLQHLAVHGQDRSRSDSGRGPAFGGLCEGEERHRARAAPGRAVMPARWPPRSDP